MYHLETYTDISITLSFLQVLCSYFDRSRLYNMLSFSETASTQAGKRELQLVLGCHNHPKLTLACFSRRRSLLSRPTRCRHPSLTKNVLSFVRPSVGGSILIYYKIFFLPMDGGPSIYYTYTYEVKGGFWRELKLEFDSMLRIISRLLDSYTGAPYYHALSITNRQHCFQSEALYKLCRRNRACFARLSPTGIAPPTNGQGQCIWGTKSREESFQHKWPFLHLHALSKENSLQKGMVHEKTVHNRKAWALLMEETYP